MALSGIQRTFAGVLNSIWGKNAQTTIPTQPVSGIAYRDTDAEFESGQKYDSLGESSRWNQLLYLLSGLSEECSRFGILPWSSAQPYSKGALCIGPDGSLWQAQVAIAVNPTNPVTPGTNPAIWDVPLFKGKKAGGDTPPGSVIPFYSVNLGGPDNRNPIFWGESEPDTGWLICDGGSDGRGGSVPDLRNRFVMCSSYSGDAGQTGGAASVTPTVSVQNATQGGSIGNTAAGGGIAASGTGVGVQGTTLDGNTLPSHNHSMISCIGASNQGVQNFLRSESTSAAWVSATNYTGNSWAHAHGIYDPGHSHGFSAVAHSHTFTGTAHTHAATANAISTVPPYYKMAYCVKLPE
ncbi:hypothetical protein HMPREF0179_00197 [Bilophila wadsworthia 3_1_6]|uniref:Phage tail collar domain-containing protein n=2 Tax=Bilophila wadsworthia TaxID=35833 RepID=E5Y1Y8_BILW3|nr:hypothetical protein [Bilophila wadsworthia]EFV46015.1 hypothetical protein HMPREF0179_00197 [Bilophila wadsworthia 3_1_6]